MSEFYTQSELKEAREAWMMKHWLGFGMAIILESVLSVYFNTMLALDCYYWFYKTTFEGLPDITFWRMFGMIIPITAFISRQLYSKADRVYEVKYGEINKHMIAMLTPVLAITSIVSIGITYIIHIWS